jgi:glyceraldehyde 3-phosphate dehydrogenase
LTILGLLLTQEALSRHLTSKGADKVLLTVLEKEFTIVHGVNHNEVQPDEINIFCERSCSQTNANSILKAVEDTLGVVKGHLETIHAYTNDQTW